MIDLEKANLQAIVADAKRLAEQVLAVSNVRPEIPTAEARDLLSRIRTHEAINE